MKNLILRTILVLSLGCTMMALLSSCATSPLGRKQLILMPAGQMTTMGISTFDGLKKETPIETNPTTNAYVKCVASAVAAQASQSAGVKEWEIIVFKDQTPNAFALPGGKIGVHTGILPVTKTPAQLAAVLGHEVGHVIAQHGNERVSESLGTQLVMTGLSVVTPQTQTGQLIMAGLGVGAQYGIALPHSRTQETEADLIGLDLMSKAGFDPRESIQLWKNMMAAGGQQPPEFMSTHPSNQTRIDRLSAESPKYVAQYEAAVRAGRHPQCK